MFYIFNRWLGGGGLLSQKGPSGNPDTCVFLITYDTIPMCGLAYYISNTEHVTCDQYRDLDVCNSFSYDDFNYQTRKVLY